MTKKQLLSRLGQIILVLLGISFITFALVMLAPGDVVRQMIAGNEDIIVSQAEIDALRAELGLDKPFFFQCSGSWCRFGATADCGWPCWALCCLNR